MTATNHAGPIIAFGSIGGPSEYNPQRGPSMFDMGVALLDPRPQFGYNAGRKQICGFWSAPKILALNVVPSTVATANIAALQVPVASTPLTLVSVSGAGITVGQTLSRSDTSALVSGLAVIDGVPTRLSLGDDGRLGLWDPTKMLARNVRVTSVNNDSAATFTVRGYDVYGFPMSEIITGANADTAAGKKAFKYVASITPAGTLAGANVSIGTGDIIGLPLRADTYGELEIVWNNASVTASTGFLLADTTSPATGTTGDVRGTYALQTASDNVKRLQVYQSPQVANAINPTGVGLFGVPHFTN